MTAEPQAAKAPNHDRHYVEVVSGHVRGQIPADKNPDQADSPYGVVGYMLALEKRVTELSAEMADVAAYRIGSLTVERRALGWCVVAAGLVLTVDGEFVPEPTGVELDEKHLAATRFDKVDALELARRTQGNPEKFAFLDRFFKPIDMQDVRLMAGEGPLTQTEILAGVNAELRRRKDMVGCLRRGRPTAA